MLLLEPPQIAGAPLDPATHRLGSAKRHFEVCSDLLPFYMLNLGTISVAQSASVWRMLQTQPSSAADVLALGVYNLNYKTDLTLSAAHQRAQELLIKYNDLAQTKSVASVLKKMERADTALLALSAWNDDQTPWPGERQSNEANFKRLLGEHAIRYILFAGHGVFNDKDPHFSGLVFNLAAPDGSAAEPAQDGFFGLNDIFNLRMPQTELTFLAACQSGLGLIARGEGVSALTRALMYHGSPSVIASLWSVDVQATMTLVEAFFAALNAQPDADKAQLLTAAKRTVAASASNPQFVHPYCWAPFVLIGKR
jgi:CHAT domain-containing protein